MPTKVLQDKHHRKPRSRGGTNESRNISLVPQHQHRAYHLLFRNMQPEEIAQLLNQKWIDPDFELIAIRKTDRVTIYRKR